MFHLVLPSVPTSHQGNVGASSSGGMPALALAPVSSTSVGHLMEKLRQLQCCGGTCFLLLLCIGLKALCLAIRRSQSTTACAALVIGDCIILVGFAICINSERRRFVESPTGDRTLSEEEIHTSTCGDGCPFTGLLTQQLGHLQLLSGWGRSVWWWKFW